MRKPVLEWEYRPEEPMSYECWELRIEGPTDDGDIFYSVSNNEEGLWTRPCPWDPTKTTYPTADEAKLACEDHLATLLEPLSAIYERLRGNR